MSTWSVTLVLPRFGFSAMWVRQVAVNWTWQNVHHQDQDVYKDAEPSAEKGDADSKQVDEGWRQDSSRHLANKTWIADIVDVVAKFGNSTVLNWLGS